MTAILGSTVPVGQAGFGYYWSGIVMILVVWRNSASNEGPHVNTGGVGDDDEQHPGYHGHLCGLQDIYGMLDCLQEWRK